MIQIKSLAYSSRGSQTGQLYSCTVWLMAARRDNICHHEHVNVPIVRFWMATVISSVWSFLNKESNQFIEK